MKRNYTTKKKTLIAALFIVAACLAGGLFYYIGTIGGQPQEEPAEATVPIEPQVTVPQITPMEIPETVETDNDVLEPEDLPDNTQEADLTVEDVMEEQEQSKPSDGKPKSPTEATPPAEPPADTGSSSSGSAQIENPQGGEKKDGKIYVPGFGWIEDKGGGSEVHIAPNAGTGEPIGEM